MVSEANFVTILLYKVLKIIAKDVQVIKTWIAAN